MQLRHAGGLYYIGLVEASRGLGFRSFDSKYGSQRIQASGPVHSLVIVAFWQISHSLFSHGIQSWHEHPLLARASTSGSSIHCWLELQHLRQAPTSVSCPCLLSCGCSTRSTTTSPWSVSNKKGLAVHSPDVHSQSPSQVQGRLLF